MPKALTGTIHLPEARLNFHLTFDGKKGKAAIGGEEVKIMGDILNQAVELSPELQELLVSFADYLKRVAEKGGQSSKE